MSSSIPPSPPSVRISQGPRPEEWERRKVQIHELYIVRAQPLTSVMAQMKEKHGFNAGSTTYNTYFRKWGPSFRKNETKNIATEAVTHTALRGPRTRAKKRDKPKVLPIGRQRELLPASYLPTQAADRYVDQLRLLNLVAHHINALFESFNFSSTIFHITLPEDMVDNSLFWQQLADECFGATTLVMGGFVSEGYGAFDLLCSKLRKVDGQNDIAMVLKFWWICMRLHKVGEELRDFKLLRRFTNEFRAFAISSFGHSHPVTHLLGILMKVPLQDLPDTLRIGYHSTIQCLENKTSSEHAIVLQTWSNFMKSCDSQACSTKRLMARFKATLAAAEDAYTPVGAETIAILHRYMYAAYYNAQDIALARSLACDLVHRVKTFLCLQRRPWWCLSTQAYALSVKLLFILAATREEEAVGRGHMENAILTLGLGDRECQTRAVMLAELLGDPGVKQALLQRIQRRFEEE